MPLPDIFEYDDYRRYLRSWFRFCARSQGKRMVGIFADRAGCSPGHLANIREGRKDLTMELVSGFCRALGLRGSEAEHFGYIVRFVHPVSDLERALAHEALMRSRIRHRRKSTPVLPATDTTPDPDLACWAHPILAALAACPGYRDDPVWIARAFAPALGLIQAAVLRDLLPEGEILALWRDPRRAVTVSTAETEEGRQRIESALARARLMWKRVPTERREMRVSVWAVSGADLPDLFASADAFLAEATARFQAAALDGKRATATQLLVEIYPLTAVLSG